MPFSYPPLCSRLQKIHCRHCLHILYITFFYHLCEMEYTLIVHHPEHDPFCTDHAHLTRTLEDDDDQQACSSILW